MTSTADYSKQNMGILPQYQFNQQFKLQIVKTVMLMVVFCAFFLKLNSLLWNMCVSTAVGCFYYLMAETQPQLVFLIGMVTRYHLNKLYSKWFKTPLDWLNGLVSSSLDKDDRLRLQREDGYSSLIYYDCNGTQTPKKYIYLFKEKERSNDLIIFKDEDECDVTAEIEPYLGPMQNFHGSKLTPRDFNHTKLIVFRDGEINLMKTFEEDDIITFEV
jgi:hypothetical protein